MSISNKNRKKTKKSVIGGVTSAEKVFSGKESAPDERSYKAGIKTAKAVNKNVKYRKVQKNMEKLRNTRMYRVMYTHGLLYFLISFIVPASIMAFAMANFGIHPFGSKQMLVVDCWHQYYPFFRVVREKLLTGGSFMYSWQNGLGSNFLSLISYYAMGPLNWISIFFNEDSVRNALTFILLLKIGFAGGFFQRFLRYTFQRNDFSTCIFSVMYALSNFTLGYYWNVMWFDTIALFPLVMLGIVKICREGKWKTFTFALALSLISNYYIGYFTCLFSILMFLTAGIVEFKSVKQWLYNVYLMIRSTLLGICLSLFITLPAYYGLETTYSADDRPMWKKIIDIFKEDRKYYHSWKRIVANTISYSEPTKVEGLPNFACGMLCILLIGVFLFSRGIKIREKVLSSGMLFFIGLSCNMRQLNYVWHGCHFTNQIPYRFAFIFSFILAAMAYRAYDIILSKGVKIYQLVLMLIGPVFVFYLNYLVKGSDFGFKGAVKSSMIITGAYWMIFLAVRVFPFRNKQLRNTLMSLALAIAVFSEFVSNAKIGVKTVGGSDYKSYPTRYDEIESLLATAKETTDDDDFYRIEMTDNYTLNDSALYGYYGVSQFSSAANVSVTRMCKKLGLYASEAGNRYYYRTNTPVVSTLFDLRFLLSRGKSMNTEEYAMQYMADAGGSYLYESRYPISLGYMMNKKILSVPDTGSTCPLEYQSKIMNAASGIDKECFEPQLVAFVDYTNMTVTKNGFGNYTFDVDDPGTVIAESKYTFDHHEGKHLYGYADSSGNSCDHLEIFCGKTSIDSGDLLKQYALVFPMGSGGEGDTSSVTIEPDSDRDSGNFKLMVYALDQEIFEEQYNALADEQLEITSFTDRKIEGRINAKEDGVLYFAIPYEKGWRVFVDGEEVDTCRVIGAMLGAEVDAGEHTIRLEYYPEGFVPGVIISFAALTATGSIMWIERKRKKKKPEETSEDKIEAGDDPDEKTGSEKAEEKVIVGEIYNQEVEEIAKAEKAKAESSETEKAPAEEEAKTEAPAVTETAEAAPAEETAPTEEKTGTEEAPAEETAVSGTDAETADAAESAEEEISPEVSDEKSQSDDSVQGD